MLTQIESKAENIFSWGSSGDLVSLEEGRGSLFREGLFVIEGDNLPGIEKIRTCFITFSQELKVFMSPEEGAGLFFEVFGKAAVIGLSRKEEIEELLEVSPSFFDSPFYLSAQLDLKNQILLQEYLGRRIKNLEKKRRASVLEAYKQAYESETSLYRKIGKDALVPSLGFLLQAYYAYDQVCAAFSLEKPFLLRQKMAFLEALFRPLLECWLKGVRFKEEDFPLNFGIKSRFKSLDAKTIADLLAFDKNRWDIDRPGIGFANFLVRHTAIYFPDLAGDVANKIWDNEAVKQRKESAVQRAAQFFESFLEEKITASKTSRDTRGLLVVYEVPERADYAFLGGLKKHLQLQKALKVTFVSFLEDREKVVPSNPLATIIVPAKEQYKSMMEYISEKATKWEHKEVVVLKGSVNSVVQGLCFDVTTGDGRDYGYYLWLFGFLYKCADLPWKKLPFLMVELKINLDQKYAGAEFFDFLPKSIIESAEAYKAVLLHTKDPFQRKVLSITIAEILLKKEFVGQKKREANWEEIENFLYKVSEFGEENPSINQAYLLCFAELYVQKGKFFEGKKGSFYEQAFAYLEKVFKISRDTGAKIEETLYAQTPFLYTLLLEDRGGKALIIAARYGHVEIARELIEKGADLAVQDKNGWTALMLAVGTGHIEIARELIEKGADLAVQDKNGLTALMVAVGTGHVEIVRELIEKGADPAMQSKDGWTALMLAVVYGHVEVARELMGKGADPAMQNKDGLTVLMVAARNGHVEIARELIEKGADLAVQDKNGSTALMHAARYRHVEVARELIEKGADLAVQDKNGSTALMYAARYGHVEVARELIEKGADLAVQDKNGLTALMVAARNGHVEVARELMGKGADPAMQSKNGWTALMYAARYGRVEIARELMGKGADPAMQSKDGLTALMLAARNGNVEIARELIEKGADLAVQDKNGWTALMYAARYGHVEIARELIEKGADPAMQNKDGLTALMIAVETGHVEIARELIERGSAVNHQNRYGATALMFAAQDAHIDFVKLLIAKGSNLNLQNEEGFTTLMLAVQHNHTEVLSFLIESKAQVDLVNKAGLTALMIASQCGFDNCVRILTKTPGISLNYENKEEKTALMYAAEYGQIKCVHELIAAGAIIDLKDDRTAMISATLNGERGQIWKFIEEGKIHQLDKLGFTMALISLLKNDPEKCKQLLFTEENKINYDALLIFASKYNGEEEINKLYRLCEKSQFNSELLPLLKSFLNEIKKVELVRDHEAFKDYCCSISYVPVLDPVSDPIFGESPILYERENIYSWLAKNKSSPANRFPLEVSQLIEMPKLKAFIHGYIKALLVGETVDPQLQIEAENERTKIVEKPRVENTNRITQTTQTTVEKDSQDFIRRVEECLPLIA